MNQRVRRPSDPIPSESLYRRAQHGPQASVAYLLFSAEIHTCHALGKHVGVTLPRQHHKPWTFRELTSNPNNNILRMWWASLHEPFKQNSVTYRSIALEQRFYILCRPQYQIALLRTISWMRTGLRRKSHTPPCLPENIIISIPTACQSQGQNFFPVL